MCPVTANRTQGKPFQFMELDLLREICRQMDHWHTIGEVDAFHFGEPLAHPQFAECLEILYHSTTVRRAQVIMYTNASLLRGGKALALLEIPVVTKLVFSFDGFGDRESYQALRGPHYDEVLQNIRDFARLARSKRSGLHLATCTILPREGEVPGLSVKPPEQALQNLKAIFAPLHIAVETRDMHDYCGADRLEISGKSKAAVFGGCLSVERDALFITVSGKAQPCCDVYHEDFNIGSVLESDIGELLNNEKMSHLRHLLRLDRREGLPYCNTCSASLGGFFSEPEFRCFWLKRDDHGLVDDFEERRYLFTKVVPTPHRAVRVDLGCGRAKQPGFIGIDHLPLPGVDILADMDKGLPLRNDSVDYLVASHSLEHTTDIIFTMQEIYRVCKHKAIVCIVAPYYHTSLNMANPYHKQIFNEHTPRFFTTADNTLVNKADYEFPQIQNWGLGASDNRVCQMDFRCLRMELFYFPAYRRLPEDKKRELRQHYMNVADQIMYHLLVVKQDISPEEIEDMSKTIRYQEPPWVTIRRLQEENQTLRHGFAVLVRSSLLLPQRLLAALRSRIRHLSV